MPRRCDTNGGFCYKNLSQSTCNDLIKTNLLSYFKHSNVFETNLSDFHLLTVTEFKTSFQKQNIDVIACYDYKKIANYAFWHDIEKPKFNTEYLKFKETVFDIFNKHGPKKKKYVRATEVLFVKKELLKQSWKDQAKK